MTDKVSNESKDLITENVEQIKKLFPGVVSEGKINLEKLKLILGEELDNKEESYSFNWAGRKDAFRNIQSTAKGTLVPNEKESINFKETQNIFIEGDNLEVLKLMQKSYFNQIKMIYIDPPYNTGHDFVYKDDFKNGIKAYLEQTGQLNGDGVLLTTNPETSGRFHSDWISMMYPRLFLARNLLVDQGAILVSVDDKEIHNLRKIMDEIFGEENFVVCFTLRSNPRGSQASKFVALEHEYVLFYAKDVESLEVKGYEKSEEEIKEYNLADEKGEKYRLLGLRQRGGAWRREQRPKLFYPVYVNPKNGRISLEKTSEFSIEALPKRPSGEDGRWTWSITKVEKNKDLLIGKKVNRNGENDFWDIFRLDYLKNEAGDIITKKVKTIWEDKEINYQNGRNELKELFDNSEIFDFPKPSHLIKKLITMFDIEDGDIILDFFAGSGTTAQAVLELNMKEENKSNFVIVQLPEKTNEKSIAYRSGYKNIAELAKERIRRVIKKLEKEEKAKLTKEHIDLGFKVFKLEKSNYKIWENYEGQDIKELTKQLDLFKSPLINGYDDYNVIYECIVKEGLSLNAKIETKDTSGNKIYRVSDGNQSFYICLDEEVKQESLNKLDLKKDDLFICLDSSLDDSKKVNISLQCKLKTL
ncbi:MAG: site-specific DNA-methyltransferase [Cuniculiplasma sp.]